MLLLFRFVRFIIGFDIFETNFESFRRHILTTQITNINNQYRHLSIYHFLFFLSSIIIMSNYLNLMCAIIARGNSLCIWIRMQANRCHLIILSGQYQTFVRKPSHSNMNEYNDLYLSNRYMWTILTFSSAADTEVPNTRSVSSTLMKSFGNWTIWYFGSGFGTSSNPRFDSWDKLSKRFMMSTKLVALLL